MQSASDIATAVSQRRVTAAELIDAAIKRIEETNPAINAIVRFDAPWAREQARDVDRRVRAGEHLALAGVPLVVKDNIWIAGRNISQGSRLFADFVGPQDAIAVARAKAAGAVIVGIGNCPEFACKGQTNSPLHGAARNPLDPSLTPGGSSGGNAAAIAAGLVPIGLGTDGGGSGRRPPAHTGTVGFKPSFGAIPYGPGFAEPFWNIAVIAPMARTVADTKLLFEVVAGQDPCDPDSIVLSPDRPVRPARALRLAYAPRLGFDVPVDDDVAAAIERGIDALSACGWQLTRAAPDWPKGLSEADLMPFQMAGLAALHGAAFEKAPELFDPDVGRQIEQGLRMTGAQVGRALETGHIIRRTLAQFFTMHDILLCPTAPCVAWSIDRLGPSEIGGVEVGPRGHAVFTPFFNHGLAPAISIPCGFGRSRLPVGLQLSARRGTDNQLLAVAAEAELALAPLNS
jgi:aspartyl-tRNA(Asn)/glutamyl-tRNA(Gln) amidotransferase subunit A